MLIYLDNAHISALDILHRRNPQAFGSFMDFWMEHGCRLIVSRAHMHELAQCEDDRDVENRLEMLRYFSIWSGAEHENVDWVIIREIQSQTLHRLHSTERPNTATYRDLRRDLYRATDFSAFQRFIWSARPGLLDELRTRRKFAEFENRSIRLKTFFRKQTGQKEPKWNSKAWKMMPLLESSVPVVYGDKVANQWLAEVRARGCECFENANRKRQALICLYDLNELAAVERAPEQDLSRLGFYRALAKHWVAPYCRLAKHDPEAIQAALDQFDPYDAPAISTALAVERGRKRHEKDYEASDFMDVDHVLWAAHADLAFVDKRTHGFLLQARNAPATAGLLSPHLTARFVRAVSLEDVQKQILKLVKEHSEA